MISFTIDPMTQEFRTNCADYYARLLVEQPVAQTVSGHWLICKHADVHRILNDHNKFQRPTSWSIDRKPEGPLKECAKNNIVGMNAPTHTRFRQATTPGFTAKIVRALSPKISKLIDDLLEEMAVHEGGDFIKDFAFPLPVYVICEMMGISHEDHDLFGECTAAMLASLELAASEETMQAATSAANTLYSYCRDAAAQRENLKGTDLISLLMQSELEGKMSREEIIWNSINVLMAGHETTTHMLGNGMLALIDAPDQLELLANDPTLAGNAVEEILRVDPTVYVLLRTNIADEVIGHQQIPAGTILITSLYAANHDPDVFKNPDAFNIRRTNANKHMTFGAGRHLCLGQLLARLEGKLAFERIFQKLSNFSLSSKPVSRNGLMFRGYHSIPMYWE